MTRKATRLEKKLEAAMRRLELRATDPIVTAVSGGADSTAMLDALVRLGRRSIVVAHLNHELRGEESDGDEEFVRQLAAARDLPVFTERIAVADRAREKKGNLEATARQLRYGFLQRIAEENDAGFVLTAHTRDDQAETILMRLLRGSGAEGLRGIHPSRPLGDRVQLVRPLLDVSRAEILTHCDHYGLSFRTDSSNLSTELVRNRIRHELLPILGEFNPRIEETIARAGELIATDDDCLAQLAEAELASSLKDEHLHIVGLGETHPAIRRRMLRLWLRERRGGLGRIDFDHLVAIERLIMLGQSGRRIELPGCWIISREFDWLRLSRGDESPRLVPESVRLSSGFAQVFGAYEFTLIRRRRGTEIPPGVETAQTVRLRESPALDDLSLRARIPGDAYMPAGSRRRLKLKTIMIRHKIPFSARETHPVLVTGGDDIVWSPGLPVASAFAVCEEDGECALVIASAGETVRLGNDKPYGLTY